MPNADDPLTFDAAIAGRRSAWARMGRTGWNLRQKRAHVAGKVPEFPDDREQGANERTFFRNCRDAPSANFVISFKFTLGLPRDVLSSSNRARAIRDFDRKLEAAVRPIRRIFVR